MTGCVPFCVDEEGTKYSVLITEAHARTVEVSAGLAH